MSKQRQEHPFLLSSLGDSWARREWKSWTRTTRTMKSHNNRLQISRPHLLWMTTLLMPEQPTNSCTVDLVRSTWMTLKNERTATSAHSTHRHSALGRLHIWLTLENSLKNTILTAKRKISKAWRLRTSKSTALKLSHITSFWMTMTELWSSSLGSSLETFWQLSKLMTMNMTLFYKMTSTLTDIPSGTFLD